MTNPVFVFIRAIALVEERDLGIFPVGLTADGKKRCNTDHNTSDNILVLFNDDENDLPGEPPFQADRREQLLVVVHASSRTRRVQELDNWRWESSIVVCKELQTLEDNPILKRIQSIWNNHANNPAEAEEFVRECREVNQLAALDGLAMLCQHVILNLSHGDQDQQDRKKVRMLKWKYENRLDVMLRDEFNCDVKNVDTEEWNKAQKLILEKADEKADDMSATLSEAHADLPASNCIFSKIKRALPADKAQRVQIFACDLNEDGAFVRFAGLDSARAALMAPRDDTADPPAILILGLLPPPEQGVGASALLQWPGAEYLRYGFTQEQLVEAADTAVRGAKAPRPCGLLPSDGDFHLLRGVRHWLTNRLRDLDQARNTLDEVLRREGRLNESHLEPIAAMSDKAQSEVERLCALEELETRMVPGGGEGPTAIRRAMDEYKLRWQDLEQSRAALRGAQRAEEGERRQCEAAMRDRHVHVRETLLAAIAAVKDLDGRLDARRRT